MSDLDTLNLTELFGNRAIIRQLVTIILDTDSWVPTWSTNSMTYYDRIAMHIDKHNDLIKNHIEDLVMAVRETYRPYQEHDYHVQRVPITRQTDPIIEDKLSEDCCVCLRPLRGMQKISRLRGLTRQCGHFLHDECLAKIVPDTDGNVRCPTCRESLGKRPLRIFVDMENDVPLF